MVTIRQMDVLAVFPAAPAVVASARAHRVEIGAIEIVAPLPGEFAGAVDGKTAMAVSLGAPTKPVGA